jgi:hypothetical protein
VRELLRLQAHRLYESVGALIFAARRRESAFEFEHFILQSQQQFLAFMPLVFLPVLEFILHMTQLEIQLLDGG